MLELAPGETVTVDWVLEPRARRLRLSVSDRGVRLSVPLRASERQALGFLREHRDWLRRQLARLPSCHFVALELHRSNELPLRGGAMPIVWRVARYSSIRRSDAGLVIDLPEQPPAALLPRLLRDFYSAEARADVGRWLPRYLPGLPRAPQRFGFRALNSLWGSLSAAGAVSLDLALVLAPPPAFEYVLVHELCHLLEPNHSPAFWREVEARFPGWRIQRRYLREHGAQFKQSLRSLLATD